MRALRTCDFCGADAAGAFEVIPPELEPTEAEQRRVVLCHDCQKQLDVLLEPLLARARGTESGRANETTTADAATEDAGRDEGGTVVATADDSTPSRKRTTSPNATVETVEPESESESDDTDAAAAESDGASASATDSSRETDADDTGGITFTSGDAAAGESEDVPVAGAGGEDETAIETDTETETETGTGTVRDDASSDEAAADGATTDDDGDADDGGDDVDSTAKSASDSESDVDTDSGAEAAADADDTDDSGTDPDRGSEAGTAASGDTTDASTAAHSSAAKRRPRAYGKVIRLLHNRNFPVERAAAADLAAGAYDLDPDEVDAIIEHAIENGEFVDESGALRRP